MKGCNASEIIVLSDPPYGVDIAKNKTIGTSRQYMPIIGDGDTKAAQKFYDVALGLGISKIILWGGNYFTDFLPVSRCWIAWDKEIPDGVTFAPIEMAWTSYDRNAYLYRWQWTGFLRQGDTKKELNKRIHPTQKPVGLYELVMNDFSGNVYLDGFLGSGSALIAAESLNRRMLGFELSPDYVAMILQRFLDFTGTTPELIG